MSLVKCKECSKEVSVSADVCPHCGAKNPGLTPAKFGKGCLGVFVFTLIFASVMYISEDKFKLNNFINKLETQLNNKPATVFTFGGDINNFCSVSINHDFFKSQNGEFSNVRRNELQFDMSCNTGGNYYVISSEHDTYAKVKFYGRSETPNTIYANIDAKLTTVDGGSLFVSGSDIAVTLVNNTQISTPSQTTNTMDEIESAKWQALQGVSDCQLALRVYNDYQPIFAELHQFVTNANNQTYQEVYSWKETTRLDARVAELDAKYPKSYPVTMTNTLFAKNLSFAIGQYWRDVHSSLRHTNNQGPIDSEQPSLMNDDLQLLKQNCPEEFGKVN